MRFDIAKREIIPDYTVESSLKSFKEEVLDELSNQHKRYGNVPLFFSGGMDSTFILRSLLELNIKPKLFCFSFSKTNDDYECNLMVSICRKFNLEEPEFIYADVDKFIEHSKHIVQEKNITYPAFHGYFMHWALSSYPDQKFHSGMGVEYKLYGSTIVIPYNPHLVKQNNRYRLLDFTTSRTFLSYINHDKFLSNYKKEVPPEYSAWESLYIRDEIYLSCYPDMGREIKRGAELTYLSQPFAEEVQPHIKDKLQISNPITFKFDVDKYLKRKINQGNI